MCDDVLQGVVLPADAAEEIRRYAEMELLRLDGWRSQGATQFEADIQLLLSATSGLQALPVIGGEVTVPAMVAATLRFYAERQWRQLMGGSAVWGDGDPELGRQAKSLRAALDRVPYTLRDEMAHA